MNYREAYGLFACNGILFNHESPIRGETFVTRKVTRGLARIKVGLDDCLYLGNLDALRDWGHAKDYVRAQWLMLQQDEPDDYVIASGAQHSVRSFITLAAKLLDISIAWRGKGVEEHAIDTATGKTIVRVDPRYFRPTEVDALLGDASKARQKLGWKAEIGFDELVREMVDADRTIGRTRRARRPRGLLDLQASRMNKDASIFVAGHNGLVGSAIRRALLARGFTAIIVRSRADLDLRNRPTVEAFFASARPEYVFLAAAKVGGIAANDAYPADFIRDNLEIQTNVIDAAYRHGVRKLCFLGSSCIYPRLAPQPIPEDSLLTGPLEPTNQWYAIAKIAGIKMCQAYAQQHGFNAISLMPTNLYGPGDNFDLHTSHVLPALLRKFHEGKERRSASVTVWGSGAPRREFLHVDDLADAVCFLMEHYDSPAIVNVGAGEDITIAALANLVKKIVAFEGTIEFDRSRPDGTPRKLLDTSKLTGLGWRPRIDLAEGIRSTYAWYLENRSRLMAVGP